MTPYEVVKNKHTLPFDLYPFQVDAVNELAKLDRAGYALDMGTGKTICSIVAALYKLSMGSIKTAIVLMPPILLTNWSRTLSGVGGTTHVIYRGTPKQRAAINLDVDFVLMSYQIFCRDINELRGKIDPESSVVICDESTAVKNVGTQTYRKFRDWTIGGQAMLLSGSPLSKPIDGYAWVKTCAPNIYRSLSQFENIHVEERDFFKNPTKWRSLDILNENMLVNSVRVLKTDVLKELPGITYSPVYYDLDDKHQKVYETLVNEQILKFEDGNKLDGTNVSALFHALQQIPMNRAHFTQEDGEGEGVALINETLEELEPHGKLAVFTSYRMTNRMLLSRFAEHGAVAVYGEVSAKDQIKAVDKFVEDPACRVIFLQIKSAGFGIDRLQHVCSNVLFAEMPLVPSHFHQACARVWRSGQTAPVNVRIAIAEHTVQVRLWLMLQEKDSIVNLCIRGYGDIKDALLGG